MRFLFLTMLATALALSGGAWSAKVALERFEGSGILVAGPWHADRLAGSVDADPYSKARLAKGGNLTLGLGEGIAFRARTDSAGAELRRQCNYRVRGTPPPARAWTLAPFDIDGRLVAVADTKPGWLKSVNLLRSETNDVDLFVGPQAHAGNWLSTAGQGPLVLALTLYDTPASTDSGAARLTMPTVDLLGCAADG